jgi:hypothetical protein
MNPIVSTISSVFGPFLVLGLVIAAFAHMMGDRQGRFVGAYVNMCLSLFKAIFLVLGKALAIVALNLMGLLSSLVDLHTTKLLVDKTQTVPASFFKSILTFLDSWLQITPATYQATAKPVQPQVNVGPTFSMPESSPIIDPATEAPKSAVPPVSAMPSAQAPITPSPTVQPQAPSPAPPNNPPKGGFTLKKPTITTIIPIDEDEEE